MWGESVVGDDGKPISTPTMAHVVTYDYKIREELAKYMNEGYDFETGFRKAKENELLRTRRHFTRPVSVAIYTSECRACTAPNIHGHKGNSSQPRTSGEEPSISKAQLHRIKQQAKSEAEREIKRKYSLMSGP